MSITCSARLASATQMFGEGRTSNKVVLLANLCCKQKNPSSGCLRLNGLQRAKHLHSSWNLGSAPIAEQRCDSGS